MNWLRKVAFEECAVTANKTGLVGTPCSSEEGTACSNSPELARTAHWAVRVVRNCARRRPAGRGIFDVEVEAGLLPL